MAEASDQERTEDPTSKRLIDARKKGRIPRSRELNTLVVLLTGSVAIFVFGGSIAQVLWQIMDNDFRLSRRDLFDPMAPIAHLGRDLLAAGQVLLPILGLAVLAALAAPAALGGWNFSAENLAPKPEKLNPMKGLGRMVSVQALAELVKSILKFLLIGFVSAALLMSHFDDLIALGRQPLLPAANRTVQLIMTFVFWLCASLGLIAVIDVPFQLWNHKRQLKMTRQEVKDEMRDMEGKPEVKSRIRSLQMALAQRRMMDEVPKADVIVTNPTHYAVALKYDQASMRAPRVVAKGADLVAAQIRSLAVGAGVPLLSAPPLARALYASTELGREIPAGLYFAVAQVLAYVYQIKAARMFGGDIPTPPTDFEIPDEFLRQSGDA
ncbi:flagellar biosynthetic protein FlhB [Methylocaldum marinum]|uniref:Flagellar biosynthetic protein FlhB n=1 Tax=Methylocaldum marinum TaxID=1432792 RepID=A0A250KX42_9GAMM|nr:flagellar biosynthesis protein FlhB [Methylocaldum marinum]BBA34339.1 flagellar biosynthetic protein FlhB [Methylocaldum marinum]